MSASLGTRLFTYLHGEFVGEDEFGNRYFRDKIRPADWRKERRWVIYKDDPEGSAVPPLWQGWLTHTISEAPTERSFVTRPWVKPHIPNLTGTPAAYRPPGSLQAGGKRDRATGDYEPWVPE
ncbi:MAG: NADH:ubiquinone oxidoreductase subunit NDUFA12 [Rhodospirillaceae bacterium]|jgi:NADH:ubiquinone oxidoreductase subunit|nr:NADH:ubiquinone oxidoreductase subunit NDUFA12 [Rhodospirillaceae bacterium]